MRVLPEMSPALKRMYWRSVLPCAVFLLLVMAQSPLRQPLAPSSAGLLLVALLPMIGLLWMFQVYVRFLRECDELERRIELNALVWAAGITLHVAMAMVFLLDAGSIALAGKQVAAWLAVCLLGVYALLRHWLHWRYRIDMTNDEENL